MSVYGTGTYKTIAAFLGGMDSQSSLLIISVLITLHHQPSDLPYGLDFVLKRVFPFPATVILPRPHSSVCMRYRNFNLLSIDYDFRPRLRSRLTQSR